MLQSQAKLPIDEAFKFPGIRPGLKNGHTVISLLILECLLKALQIILEV